MLFFGGMTMGYLEPPRKGAPKTKSAVKSVRRASGTPSARKKRKATKKSFLDLYKILAWRVIC